MFVSNSPNGVNWSCDHLSPILTKRLCLLKVIKQEIIKNDKIYLEENQSIKVIRE